MKVNQEFPLTNQKGKSEKRIRKKCFGCGDNFTQNLPSFATENYDYCRNCEINGRRYILKENRCPECGDGSGIIKFPHQPPRPCKLCSLTKPLTKNEARSKLHSLTGIITSKEPYKVYNKTSAYLDNQCYKLQIVLERSEEKQKLFVYPNLVTPQIFQTIEQSYYIDKRYLFFCEKKPKRWVLHNWKELNPSEKLANHAQEK